MTYLLLAVGCSLAIAMIFKHAGQQGLDRMSLLTANYAVAALLALLLIAVGAKQQATTGLALEPGLVALGLGTGGLFIGGFFLLSLATDVAGMSVATGVMRVSVVVPFLASWWIWGEVPTLAQGAGLICAGIAFFMITAKSPSEDKKPVPTDGETTADRLEASSAVREHLAGPSRESVVAEGPVQQETSATGPMRTFGVLALLFVAGGAVDTCMKTFDEVFAAESSRPLFLLMIFGVAFLIGSGELMRRRRVPASRTLVWGALLGIVNYGSVEFILRAIRALRGPFVFPANNISIVVGATLLGMWFWGERLSAINKAGLLLAALALFLLRP